MKRPLCFILAASLLIASAHAHAFTTAGFANPYGVAIDLRTNFLYVSNMNGPPDGRDDNGFVSRLKGDGTVDQLKFIDGASAKVALHAPKGMAISGTTLYVADIEKLHAFDAAGGAFLFDVNFGDLPVQHFYDVKLGADGALYLADGPGNTIYRIDIARQHEVTVFAQGDALGQPHSLAWLPGRQAWIVAGWSSGQVIGLDRTGKRLPLPAIFLRTLEGMDADEDGNAYVASTGLAAIYRIGASSFGLEGFRLGLATPAGIAYQRGSRQLLVASTEGNSVQSFAREPEAGGTVLPELPPLLSMTPPGMAIQVQKAEPPAPATAKAGEKAQKPAAAPPPKPEPKKEEANKPEPQKKEEAKAPEAPKPAPPEKKKGEALDKLRLPQGSD